MRQLEVSVIICAYDKARWDELTAAVSSVQHQVCPAREIIVVVDHNPALLQRVRASFPQVVAIANTQPRGLSGARNSGTAAAHGTIVAFLDDDAIAAPDWLARLTEKYADTRVVGVGGSVIPNWEKERPLWFPEEFDWVVGCTYRGMPQTAGQVRNLIGCNMSFRRDVYAQVSGFRAGFGQVGASMLRCDETEFCIRVRKENPDGMIVYEPQAQVYHHVPSNRAQWSYFRTRCITEGIAKAKLSRLLGTRDGLSSERSYTLRALPLAILRGLANAVRLRDPHGLARAGAIALGLGFTAIGFAQGTLEIALERAPRKALPDAA